MRKSARRDEEIESIPIEVTQFLGSGALASGTASYATSSLSAGTHTIYATYSGDTKFVTSKSHVKQKVKL
jgi:hypothetical protein